MARPLRPGDLVLGPNKKFGLVVAVEKPSLDDPNNPELRWRWHVVIDGMLRSGTALSEYMLVQPDT